MKEREHKYCFRQQMTEDNATPIGVIHKEPKDYEMIAKDGKMCGTWKLCEDCFNGYTKVGWKCILIPPDRMDTYIFQSRDIHDYEPILEGLVEDFGYIYYHAILKWCGILKNTKEEEGRFWEVFLIEKEKKIIGICGLYSQYPNSTDELWLGWFGVIPTYRNSGIGSIALNQLEEEAKKVGCKKILSYVDKEGKPLSFYFRCGYKRICSVEEYLSEHKELTMENFEGIDDNVIEKIF